MPRILNIQIPNNKRLVVGLTFIKGIGRSRAKSICKQLSIDEAIYVKQLSKNQLINLKRYIQKHYKIGFKIDSERIANIRKLIKISSYRGLRHFEGLPLRGQRTKTNAKTIRRVDRNF